MIPIQLKRYQNESPFKYLTGRSRWTVAVATLLTSWVLIKSNVPFIPSNGAPVNFVTFLFVFGVRAHLHSATATSLAYDFCYFGVVLLHWAFVTATNFAVAGESLCDWFRSDVADPLLSLDVNGLLKILNVCSHRVIPLRWRAFWVRSPSCPSGCLSKRWNKGATRQRKGEIDKVVLCEQTLTCTILVFLFVLFLYQIFISRWNHMHFKYWMCHFRLHCEVKDVQVLF